MQDSKPTTSFSDAPDSIGDWRMEDVIDFEYLLEQDHDRPLTELEARDHRIFKEQILPQSGVAGRDGQTGRRRLFRRWLEARRRSAGTEQLLPGELLIASWYILLKLFAVAGLLLGAGAAANLLSYDGQQPVNVAAYLGWLVLIQIILVLIAGVIVLLRKNRFLAAESSVLGSLIRSIWSWMTICVHRHGLSRVSADQRTRFAAFLGTAARHRSIYGDVGLWPVFGSLQLFGVCFNIGALLTTIALVVFSDRAFGWQSAVDFSPEQIHQLTKTLAMPWSWAVSNAAPTLEQIEGSRIVLKDGIKQLATGNLVSWWPFLCLALGVYGLLPRLILWVTTMIFGRRAWQQLSFNQVAFDRLYERLQTAGLQTSGQGEETRHTPTPNQNSIQNRLTGGSHNASPGTTAVALISAELLHVLDQNRFSELVEKRFHLSISQLVEWSDQSATMHAAIEQLQKIRLGNGQPHLILLEEAWQPPIAEKISGIRKLRDALGSEAKIIVALIGRPDDNELLTAARPTEKLVWERQIQSLGDTQLRLEQLVDHE